jgi:hypothetical protein
MMMKDREDEKRIPLFGYIRNEITFHEVMYILQRAI